MARETNANAHKFSIADGVHSFTDADKSDYESVALTERGLPIPRPTFHITRPRPQPPATQVQATNQDTMTLARILATIGRLEYQMDQLGNQFRTKEGPITQGLFEPTRRNNIPGHPLGKEVDDMALLVAGIKSTLETKIGHIQLQAKEYKETVDSFNSSSFIKAITDEVIVRLAAQDKGKGKGKGKATTEKRIMPAVPLPTLTGGEDEEMDWAAVVEETEKAERRAHEERHRANPAKRTKAQPDGPKAPPPPPPPTPQAPKAQRQPPLPPRQTDPNEKIVIPPDVGLKKPNPKPNQPPKPVGGISYAAAARTAPRAETDDWKTVSRGGKSRGTRPQHTKTTDQAAPKPVITPLIWRNHGRSLYIATTNGDLHR